MHFLFCLQISLWPAAPLFRIGLCIFPVCWCHLPEQKTEEITCEGVFNLSGEELTKSDKLTLNQGLKYAPRKPLNTFQIFLDVQKYTRKLSIKRYFLTNPIMRNYTQAEKENLGGMGLRNASLFNPHGKPASRVKITKG